MVATSIAPVVEPIWFTFNSKTLQALQSEPSATRFGAKENEKAQRRLHLSMTNLSLNIELFKINNWKQWKQMNAKRQVNLHQKHDAQNMEIEKPKNKQTHKPCKTHKTKTSNQTRTKNKTNSSKNTHKTNTTKHTNHAKHILNNKKWKQTLKLQRFENRTTLKRNVIHNKVKEDMWNATNLTTTKHESQNKKHATSRKQQQTH